MCVLHRGRLKCLGEEEPKSTLKISIFWYIFIPYVMKHIIAVISIVALIDCNSYIVLHIRYGGIRGGVGIDFLSIFHYTIVGTQHYTSFPLIFRKKNFNFRFNIFGNSLIRKMYKSL